MRKHNGTIRTLTAVMMGLNFVILGIVFYMLFWPVKFPIIYNEPFPVSPSIVHKGETLTYTMELEKFKEYPVDVHQNILCADGNLVTLSSSKSNFSLGRHIVDINVIIPQKASYSTCYIELNATYHVNAIRNENKVMRTQDFQIVE